MPFVGSLVRCNEQTMLNQFSLCSVGLTTVDTLDSGTPADMNLCSKCSSQKPHQDLQISPDC